MTFSSIYFAKLFKIDSFSASRVIYNEDALLMIYYHTGIYLSEYEISKIHKHSLKYKTVEEEFNKSSSEAATKGVLSKSCS